MKIKYYISFLFLLTFLCANAQIDFYYTFNNQKINLTKVIGKKLIEFPKGLGTTNQMIPLKKPGIQLTTNSYVVLNSLDLSFYNEHKANPIYITSEGIEMHYTSEVLLKYKKNTSLTQKQNVLTNFGLTLLKKTPSYELYRTNADALQISKLIYQNGLVEFCTPNFIAKVEKFNHIPNDQYFNQQWYLHNTGQGTNDGKSTTVDADIDAPEAWGISKGSSNVVIAIIDEGVTNNHPDLPNSRQVRLSGSNFAHQYDGTNNQNNPSPTTSTNAGNNHGNSCAGIVGATQDNNQGISGVAPLCKIMPVKIPFGSVPANVYADAIDFAVTNNADILSNSWGYNTSNPNFQPVIVSAINNAISNGKIVVFAAGNTANRVSGNNGFVNFPGNANISELITVGASDRNNNQANYSPNGTTLEIVAPSHTAYNSQINGESFNIWTIDTPNSNYGYNSWKESWAVLPAVGETLPNSGTNYSSYTGRMGGTSASTPIVAGVLALMKSINPCLSSSQMKEIIQSTADKIGGFNYNWNSSLPGHSLELGYGKINAYAAVQVAQSMGSPTLDLYVKDSPDDDGTEPNTVTEHMWTSQDIWIRNSNDNGLTHQNPEYRTNGNPNYINVRVINKSCVASTGSETLTVNWAKANTALAWPQNWDGSLTNGTHPLGGALSNVSIPLIPAGGEAIVKIPWVVPNPDNYSDNDNPWHFCLLSRINATDDPLTSPLTSNPNVMVRNNNNLAWKNLTVVDLVADRTSAMVMIANPSNTPKTYYLELQKATNEGGKAIYEEAEVTLKMDDVIYDAWERGGKQAQLIASKREEKSKLVKGDNVILDNIMFEPNERGLLTLDFNFLTKELTDKTEFTYHVVQKDANTGEVIGGETFLIKKKSRPIFIANAGNDKEINENETITLSAEQINEAAIYNWYDTDGNLIYQGKDLTVSADVTKKYKLEIVSETDGFKDYDEVKVKLKPSIIENISPNPASNQMQVNYKLNGISSAYLMIIGQYGTNDSSNNYVLNTSSSQTTINLSNYTNGYYTVALVCNGEIVDAKTLIKQ